MQIGMKVIALATHPFNGFVKGEIYTITGFDVCKKCGDLLYSIGKHWDPKCKGMICSWCNHIDYTIHSEHFYSHKCFAPLEEKGETFIENYIEVAPPIKKGIEFVNQMGK